MMKIKYIFALLLGLICALPAHAELQIDVSGATREPMPIAFPKMIHGSNAIGQLFGVGAYARKIRDVVMADLDRSGLFRIIDESSYIEDLESIDQKPTFTDWRVLKAEALIQSAITETSDNKLKVEIRLWDVLSGDQLHGQSYTTSKDNWRRIAHIISDAIYERLTGEKGYFDTRIVYVSESGPATKRVKRLAIMDQDGENHRFLTSGATMALTPRFAPNMQKVTYLSFSGSAPRVYIMDVETGKQEILGNFPGMTFAPVFSPDNSKVLLSFASRGNTEIYEMNLRTKRTRQLTKHPAIDTSPSYSPDGSKIVFNSDRGGNQQLYVMDADGSNVQRISFGNGRYATPAWSPRGDYIAFTKMAGGQFYIGVMYPDGSGERLLASGYLVEGPTWSPNGRVLMFFRQDRGTSSKNAPVQLYTIDVSGYNERRVITPDEGSDPAWSPLLP
jgi:TolB protein